MTSYSRSTVTDQILLRDLVTHLSENRASTATLLADPGEVEERKLYVPAAYPSMHLYCVNELHMSEEPTWKRLRAARAAREFPAIFPALADGRLHLTAIVLLARRLTAETAHELLAAATHKRKSEIERLLAERFPKPDVATSLRPIAPAGDTDGPALQSANAPEFLLSPGTVVPSATSNVPVQLEPLPARTRLHPLSPGKYAVEFTLDESMYEDLLAVKALLGHVLPSGDVKEVFRRVVRDQRKALENRKFAKCDRPRPQKGVAKGRHIPAAVKRDVYERDGDQCTFVSDKGKRCESRTRLELDHIEPIARGGESTVGNLRLRCRVHHQFETECTFGSEFMRGKREQAREWAAQAKAIAEAKAEAAAEAWASAKANAEAKAQVIAEVKAHAAAKAQANAEAKAQAAAEAASQKEVIPWLRALGCNAGTARRAAERCVGMVGASLERRVFVACQGLAPTSARRALPVGSAPA